jgi:hypothetical protein
MRVDRLFIRPFDLNCSRVRAALEFEPVFRDDFRGKQGQELRVYTALSNSAVSELLERFGVESKSLPLLVTWDNLVVEGVEEIIMHFRRNGMIKE